MGMSASQARLIALTARMNDIEYQGQQINQQRTTLSNQINALYSSLLDMNVPTPPAKSDFTIVEYGGNIDASKFTLGAITPAGKYTDTDIQLYNIDLNFSTTGLSVEKETGKTPLKFTAGTQYYSKIDTDKLISMLFKTEKVIEQTSENAKVDFNNIDNINNDQDIMLELDESEFNNVKNLNSDGIFVKNEDGSFSNIDNKPNSGSKIYVKINAADLKDYDATPDILKDLIWDTDTDNKHTYKNGLVAYKTNPEEVLRYTALKNANYSSFYIVKDGNIKQLTYDDIKDIKNTSDLNNLAIYSKPSFTEPSDGEYFTETINGGENVITVGTSDQRVYEATDTSILNKYDNIDDCRTALKNSFPKLAQNLAEGEDILDKFYVYFEETKSNKLKPHFILKEDISTQLGSNTLSAYTYAFDEDGTYTDTQEKKGCRLEFDSKGRITQIGIPNTDANGNITTWTWVKTAMTETTDNDAYDDAFNEYEYKKYLYDKEQQKINAKTSIIQAEDKNLELKLTRLDNERNAVKTEIEAVNKVVDDNIEKSFKTFSG